MSRVQIDLPTIERLQIPGTDEETWDLLQIIAKGFESSGGAWIAAVGEAGGRRVQWVPAGSSVAAFFDGELEVSCDVRRLRVVGDPAADPE